MYTETDFKRREHERNGFKSSLVIKTSAYSAGQVMGGVITIGESGGVRGPFAESGQSAILQGITAFDPDKQNCAIDLFFFNQSPTSLADGASFIPSATDMQNCIGVVSIAATDYADAGNAGTIAAGKNQTNLGRVIKPFSGTSAYCIAVVRGTPTYAGGKMTLRFQFSHGL